MWNLVTAAFVTSNPLKALAEIAALLLLARIIEPIYGSTEFLQTLNELSFLGTELHATFGPLFNPTLTPEARAAQNEKVLAKFKRLDAKLAGKVDGRE